MPVPNRGAMASALGRVAIAVRILEMALPQLGSGTDEGREVINALRGLSKIAPPGSGSPGVEQSSLQNLLAQQRADSPLLQQLRARAMQGGAAPGTPPAAPQAAA